MSKKDEQINVAVTSADYARANALQKLHGIKPTEMGRIGLVEVMNRLEFNLPPVKPAEAMAMAELRRSGLDPLAVMQAAIVAKISAQENP